MSQPNTVPVALSVEAIQSAVMQYKAQSDHAVAEVNRIDRERTALDEQRQVFIDSLRMLSGAIAALEQVLRNVADEQVGCAAPLPTLQD